MKITHHVPTEQYGFTEIEVEGMTAESMTYEEAKSLVLGSVGPGIDNLAFSSLVDRYMASGTMLAEEYEELNSQQQFVIQTLKKYKKRQNGKDQ